MSFPRYPKYKDSGVEWLGEVPEEWEIKPLRAVGYERQEGNAGLMEANLLSLSYGRIVRKDIETLEGLLPASFETYQIVYADDIVFRLTDLQNDKRSLRTAIVKERGIITFAYTAFAPKNIEPRYLSYLLRDYDLRKVFYSMGGGVRQSMKFEDIRLLPLVVPPSNEQERISDFLDQETAKIDALIEEQRRLIELLKEKRQAVISHAVTKGLDSSAPLQEAGIDWMGEIPSHWKLEKLSRVFRASKGKRGQLLTKEYCGEHPGSHPVFSGQTVGDGVMGSIDDFEFEFPESGVLFSTTVGAKAMHLRRVSGRFSLSQNCMIIWPIQDGIDIRFFSFHCQPLFAYERDMIPDHMQASFRMEDLYGYVIAVPPPQEQEDIAIYLLAQDARIDLLSEEATSNIRLLQERRSALISAAVTGKIDVRNYKQQPSKVTEEMYEPA